MIGTPEVLKSEKTEPIETTQETKKSHKEKEEDLPPCPDGLQDVHACKALCIRAKYTTGRFHHTGKCECRNTILAKDACPAKSESGQHLVKSTPVEKKRICA